MQVCVCVRVSRLFSLALSHGRSLSLYDFALFWLRVVNGAHWKHSGLRGVVVDHRP